MPPIYVHWNDQGVGWWGLVHSFQGYRVVCECHDGLIRIVPAHLLEMSTKKIFNQAVKDYRNG